MQPFPQWLAQHDFQPRTLGTYIERLAAFAAWFRAERGVEFAPTELTAIDVRVWREAHQSLSVSTINLTISALRAYVRWCIETGQLTHDPLTHVQMVSAPELAPRWLDRKQQAALLRVTERQQLIAEAKSYTYWIAVRNKAAVNFLLHTGLRANELCTVHVGDVQMAERSGAVKVRGKGAVKRTVPLNVDARRAVQEWLAVRAPNEPPSTESFLFISYRGEPLSRGDVHAIVQAAAKLAEIECSPHTLRHTFAKNLIDAGVRESEVAKLLGHARLDTTRRYTLPSAHDLQRAVERLE